MALISIGNCSKYNIYFLISVLCYFLINFLFGLNPSNKEKPVCFFPFTAKIKSHKLLDNFIRLSSIFFGGLILYFYERKHEGKRKKEIIIGDNDCSQFSEDNLEKKKDDSIKISNVIVGVLFFFFLIFKDFVGKLNVYIGFWTIEIIYICIISYFILKVRIARHKKLAIYIMLGLSVFEFISFFLPSTKHENKDNMNELTDKSKIDIIIIKYGAYAIPLIFLANELIHVQRDYCWIKAKYLMDIKLFSPAKIFMTIGIFGFTFIIIFFSIFTCVPCKTINNVIKQGDSYIDMNTNKPLELFKEYCSLKDYDENTKTLYFFYDNIKLISKEYSNTEKENMLEILLIIPLLFIFYLINEISRLMMVRHADPNNILIYKDFYYILKRIIVIIINKGDEQYLTYEMFFISEIEELVSIISNMIYIEVLELKFCKLDYELKKNIIKRSNIDSNNILKSSYKLEKDVEMKRFERTESIESIGNNEIENNFFVDNNE